jgi:hypothetical protein
MLRITSYGPPPKKKKISAVLSTNCRLSSKHFFPTNRPLEAAPEYWHTFRAMSNSVAYKQVKAAPAHSPPISTLMPTVPFDST